MHQTVGNILRTLLRSRPPRNLGQAQYIIDDALATAQHAMRCAVSRATGVSPGAMVFQRDMFLDLPLIADLALIQSKRQLLIDDNLRRQNQRRREWNYIVGDEVLIKVDEPTKLAERTHGPYRITQLYTNGTVDVRLAHHVVERLNIRWLVPYRR